MARVSQDHACKHVLGSRDHVLGALAMSCYMLTMFSETLSVPKWTLLYALRDMYHVCYLFSCLGSILTCLEHVHRDMGPAKMS
jgi:hypothetical protein